MQPETRKAQPAPPPPTINDARISAERNDTMRDRRGRSATFMSSAASRSTGGVATKALMGQGG